MKQHIIYEKGGTLSVLSRDANNNIIYPDTGATYTIWQAGAAATSDTAALTGDATLGWSTTLTANHYATSGNYIMLSTTTSVKSEDVILLTNKRYGYSELAKIWRVTESTGRVRLQASTKYDYSIGDYVQNPVMKVSLTPTQTMSASLLGLDENHRLEIDYAIGSVKTFDSVFFDIVQRWPRPPITELDIYDAKPELRDEISDQTIVRDFIITCWEDVLDNVRARGHEPQYLQNEEALARPLRMLVLSKLCRDVGEKTADDIWKGLSVNYAEEYMNAMETIESTLQFDTTQAMEKVGADAQFGCIRFERGGRGTRWGR
jgi:hypothetical protein